MGHVAEHVAFGGLRNPRGVNAEPEPQTSQIALQTSLSMPLPQFCRHFLFDVTERALMAPIAGY